MIREVSRDILEGLIRSSRRSLLPEKEELNRVSIELVEAEKNVQQKNHVFLGYAKCTWRRDRRIQMC